ncbi:MAG: sulfotransferase family protein [Porticoccaceae bacterium]
MALSLIGAGFGRTGTVSLRAALEQLGHGPVYHMMEVFKYPEHGPLWVEALEDSKVLEQLLDGYQAAIDWPACHFWEPLLAANPQAKVILTVRDSESWYTSIHNTLYQMLLHIPATLPDQQISMGRRIIWEETFAGELGDKDRAISVYEKHNARVVANVLPEQLLVYQVSEGWAPLCDFLGCEVPAETFPKSNTTEEFLAQFQK